MTNPNELLILIRLLKAEGVVEYRNNEFSLRFAQEAAPVGAAVSASAGAEALGPQAKGAAGAQDAQGTLQGAGASAADEAAAGVELPAVLKRLNPNYARLTGLRK